MGVYELSAEIPKERGYGFLEKTHHSPAWLVGLGDMMGGG